MIRLLESWGAGKGSFVENGQYLALFLVVLLFLCLTEKHINKEFTFFSGILALLLLCPFTAKVLLAYQTAFFAHETVWELLPLTVLLAYGMVFIFSEITAVMHAKMHTKNSKATGRDKRSRVYEILTIVMFTVVLFLGGSVSFAETVTEKSVRQDRLPQEIGEVLDMLVIPEETGVLLLAPDEVVAWARLYSGNIIMPYGRDISEVELTAYLYDTYTEEVRGLRDWVEGDLPAPENVEEACLQEKMYAEYCRDEGYDYLIFTVERANNDLLAFCLEQDGGYEILARTEAYVIYGKNKESAKQEGL